MPSRGTSAEPARRLGREGEQIAYDYLHASGFVILDRNWRCPLGELDIVARDGEVLVAVEVKTRRSTRFGSPAEAVDARKVLRLHRLAYRWRQEKRPVGCGGGTRVDVVAILAPAGVAPTVSHNRGLT